MSIRLSPDRTYVIAEAGVNHDGDIRKAYELIEYAKDAGADAMKLQMFQPAEIASPASRKAEYQTKNEGAGAPMETQQQMLERLALKPEDFADLKKRTEAAGIDFITTPFDVDSARFLAGIGVKAIKIPSGEVTNLPFLRHVADLGVFTIISTGMCNLEEIRDAVAPFEERSTPYALLHCISSYPAPDDQINLRAMDTMQKEFGVMVGYSDHTKGIEASLAAAALGATLIEKHYTYDKTASGPDHAASLEPEELAMMMRGIRLVEEELKKDGVRALPDEEKIDRVFSHPALRAMVDRSIIDASLGSSEKKCQPCEMDVLRMGRRSCQLAVPLRKGDVITREMIVIRRPLEHGLPPKMLDAIVGTHAARDMDADTILTQDDLA